MPLPAAIANAPQLEIGLEFYFAAFMDLTSCRAVGMGEGPIPWLAMRAYALDSDLEAESREDLMYYVGRMDTAYLEYRARVVKEKASG